MENNVITEEMKDILWDTIQHLASLKLHYKQKKDIVGVRLVEENIAKIKNTFDIEV